MIIHNFPYKLDIPTPVWRLGRMYIEYAYHPRFNNNKLLFAKLRTKGIFKEDEIQFLEQLYARYHIKVGASSFRPNKALLKDQ